MTYFISPVWGALGGVHWLLILLMAAAAIGPYVYAVRGKTSLALATTLSILLVYVVQSFVFIIYWLGLGWHSPLLALMAIPDQVYHPGEYHRFITAAWVHSMSDVTHVLGNALIIALVGVPLEQRLGRRGFMIAYICGALAGNIAWCLANLGSPMFGLGASGAAFGLLGVYLACWPRDEIEFPLILIRRWPVQLIALLYLGIEIVRAWAAHGLEQASDVAHVAHLAGFLFCYAIARPLASRGPVQPDTLDGGPSQAGAARAIRTLLKDGMASLDHNPWEGSNHPLDASAARTLQRLRDEGDELETREAWLERLSEQAVCPNCGSDLGLEGDSGAHHLVCTSDSGHLSWPR